MKETTGCVYLVGAGCGKADLITLRGQKYIQHCDVLVYDDLIDPALLQMVPTGAECIYMGKRKGQHSAHQETISQTLVTKAQEGKVVVRLKGGDPFVFGRGGEEILALQQAEIPYEEVPGISSCIAIPAAAGIPVTHRQLSRGFHVITAHTNDTENGLPQDFDHLAGLQGTLVFLMGLSRLGAICTRLMEMGKAETTPVAVVSGGNSPHPYTVRGTLSTIQALVAQAAVQSPAVIVVGEVAALDFSPTIQKPLTGVRVALTGTAAITNKLAPGLEEQGAQVLYAQTSRIIPYPPKIDLHQLGAGKWVVFTGSNGVRLFFQSLREQKIDIRTLYQCKFAVIGSATGKTLEEYGIHADLCPREFTSAGLGQALISAVSPEEEIILFRSQQGSALLPLLLDDTQLQYRDVPLYHLQPVQTEIQEAPQADYLIFSSALGVSFYCDRFGVPDETTTCVCIGEVTAEALKRRTRLPFLVADEISAQGIIQAILKHQTTK